MYGRLTVPFYLFLVGTSRGQSFNFEDSQNEGSPCYGLEDGSENLDKPVRCSPPFKNVVAGLPVDVRPPEMTCGMRSKTTYCVQTGGFYRECDICDAFDPDRAHNGSYLTDIHTDLNQTWWQSVTMFDDVHTTEVNLTVNLRKAYDIVYVRLKFHSPRPESFAIYKKNRRDPHTEDPEPNEGWIPWQYYSATCRDTYGVSDSLSIMQPRDGRTKISEDRALCNSDFSDISPLTGGNVAFSTLEGRPSAFYFDDTPELQQWVSATDIRVSLRRLNTFGDEVFGDFKVLQSYYYAITHFQVGGRCQCNGHSNVCIPSDPEDDSSPPMCLCKHGTAGRNCETCLPDHWDKPWRRATSENPNECKPCDCNGFSTRCRFNEMQFTRTGRGGECIECQGNRDGPHCERCLPNHFMSPVKDAQGRQPCTPCDCNPDGSEDMQCSPEGKCACKKGVTGDKCDMCEANHWSFPDRSAEGCKPCNCYKPGSLENRENCAVDTGKCDCKQNVEGQRCDVCKPGHFEIDVNNDFGCTPCFCYGHTAQCDTANGYTKSLITSDFSRGDGGWQVQEFGNDQATVSFDSKFKLIGVQSTEETAYFIAPEKFRGDQRATYNHDLRFKLKIGAQDVAGARPSVEDIVIEGGDSQSPTTISLAITDQGNPMPSYEMQDYKFRLHEDERFGWRPQLRPKDFMAVLSNIQSVRIRGTYVARNGLGFLDEVQMDSAEVRGNGPPARWIERCTCPPGYEGNHCERCQAGYHHENNGGPFARCIPCNCNGHSDYCDIESGKCDCNHNTEGHNCESCARGYYGDAIQGTIDDCKECPCPYITDKTTGQTRIGACLEIIGDPESPICLECPEGRAGPKCEYCADGYFGDPNGLQGPPRPCQKCDCNGNVDPNAIGNCDSLTGKCLRCIDDTAGDHCELCKSGFYGSATAARKPGSPQNCQPCQCYPQGTYLDDAPYGEYVEDDKRLPKCNSYTGMCECKPNVVGHDCDQCKDGYFRIDSNMGCDPCNCDPVGSINGTCNVYSGQCFCRPGVTGVRCDMCEPYHYGFSLDGCKPCECDPTGSTDLQCDELNGQCPCRSKVEGRKCDRCMENTRTRDTPTITSAGGAPVYGEKICEPCDDCYNLVQESVDQHRANLDALENLLQEIAENPEPVGTKFEDQLRQLRTRVNQLIADSRIYSPNVDGQTLRGRLEDLAVKLTEVINLVLNADTQLDVVQGYGDEAKNNIQLAESIIKQAREEFKNAKNQMDVRGRDSLRKAQERSKKFGEGSEKMSQIASAARQLAEQQIEDANEISSIAKQAYTLANDAHDAAYRAVEEHYGDGDKIKTLNAKLAEVTDKFGTLGKLSSNTLAKASDAYKEALSIYQQVVNLEVPKVEDAKLESQAKVILQDAERIKEDAQRLINEHSSLVQTTQDKRMALQDLLNRATEQQQKVDGRLADLDRHRSKALEAVDIGNNVLKDAQDTLDILKDFENRVSNNKDQAEQSLKEVDAIRGKIREANDKTERASRNLNEAETSSHLAFDIARTSKGIAEKASDKAKDIVTHSEEAKNSAKQLRTDAESLKQKLEETEVVVKEKNDTATIDADLASEVLRVANLAQTKASEASNKVEQAKRELEEIAAILNTVEEPEPGLLDALEERVRKAESKFREADLELRLDELELAKQKQIDRLAQLSDENEIMTEEMKTIESILSDLSDSCPKAYNRCLEDEC